MLFLAACPVSVICNIPLRIGNCCCWGGIPEKRKQWISVSFWSDYIIWLLNASLFKILELFWISATGISVIIILFDFENLWHECKFYRWWIKHHQLLGMVCPFCTKSQKAMLGFTGEEEPFKRRLQIQVRLWSFFYDFHSVVAFLELMKFLLVLYFQVFIWSCLL